MNTEERQFVAKLPDEVTIYRGMTELEEELGKENPKEYGISWTLSKKVARYFIEEYKLNYEFEDLDKVIIKKKIRKEKIVAYFADRNEKEIIYFPWK